MVQGANLVVYGNSFYDIAGRLMHFDLCKLYGIYIYVRKCTGASTGFCSGNAACASIFLDLIISIIRGHICLWFTIRFS